MNILLWILQIILAIKFFSTAFTHGLGQGSTKMARGLERMGSYARPVLYLVAVFSMLAAAGLILPAVPGATAWTAVPAAAVLAAMNLLSLVLHRACREKHNLLPNLVLFAMAGFTAYGRWLLAPL
jgi:hypothetical protein